MFERFEQDGRAAVLSASRQASEVRFDSHIGTEHLLLGVVEAGAGGANLVGVSGDDLRRGLEELDHLALGAVGVAVPIESLANPARRRKRHIPFTSGAKQCLKRSLEIAIEIGSGYIAVEHLIAALVSGDRRDPAVRLLIHLGLDPGELAVEARQALQRRAS